MGQRSTTELVAFDLLVHQIDSLQQTIEVLAGQRSPTGQRSATDAVLASDEHKRLEKQIGQLKDDILQLAGQRSTT